MKNDLRKRQTGLRYLWMVLCGKIEIKKIIKKNPGRKLILSDIGVGDQVFMLSYLKKWVKYYHINDWKILAINTKDSLYKSFFITENRMIKITTKKCRQIDLFCASAFGRRFRMRHSEIMLVNALGYFRGTWLLENPCIFDFASLTKAVYRIPQATEPSACTGCEVEKLLCSLREQGITELGNQTSLNGTIRVDLPLDEMFTLCNTCGMLIGARSGFMDMMAFTDADIICISNKNYEYADLFQLEKCWPQNPKIKTIYFDDSNENMIVNQIVEHFCVVFEKKNAIQNVHD